MLSCQLTSVAVQSSTVYLMQAPVGWLSEVEWRMAGSCLLSKKSPPAATVHHHIPIAFWPLKISFLCILSNAVQCMHAAKLEWVLHGHLSHRCTMCILMHSCASRLTHCNSQRAKEHTFCHLHGESCGVFGQLQLRQAQTTKTDGSDDWQLTSTNVTI